MDFFIHTSKDSKHTLLVQINGGLKLWMISAGTKVDQIHLFITCLRFRHEAWGCYLHAAISWQILFFCSGVSSKLKLAVIKRII